MLPTPSWKFQNSFLFASFNEKTLSTRRVHLHRLADLLYVCIHRRDWERAARAWSILTRCPEFKWQGVWQFGIMFASSLSNDNGTNFPDSKKSLEYLRISMLRIPQKRVAILQEIVIQLIHLEEYRRALEELELYLPSFPYQEDFVLNIYAALLHLYLSCQVRDNFSSSVAFNENMTLIQNHVRECKGYLRRASELGKDHPMSSQILDWLESNPPDSQAYHNIDDTSSESEKEMKLEG